MKCLICDKFACKRGYCNVCYSMGLRNGSIHRKYPKNIPLTSIQNEFIIGSLLGDGWLTNLKYGRKNPSFGIDRKQDDLQYLKWQFSFVENLCSREISLKDKLNKETNKIQKHCLFETRYLPSLLEFRKIWYPNDIKIIPNDLKITQLIMQIWYCDDGSLEVFDSGKFRMKFSTHGFTEKENLYLIDLLFEKYKVKLSLHKDNNKFKLCANSDIAPIIYEDIKYQFPIEIMPRKFIV